MAWTDNSEHHVWSVWWWLIAAGISEAPLLVCAERLLDCMLKHRAHGGRQMTLQGCCTDVVQLRCAQWMPSKRNIISSQQHPAEEWCLSGHWSQKNERCFFPAHGQLLRRDLAVHPTILTLWCSEVTWTVWTFHGVPIFVACKVLWKIFEIYPFDPWQKVDRWMFSCFCKHERYFCFQPSWAFSPWWD